MRISKKCSIAVCALLLPCAVMAVDTWWVNAAVGYWDDALNWTAGVPTASNKGIINTVDDVCTITNSGASASVLVVNQGASLTVASTADLTVGGLNVGSEVGDSTIVVDGLLTHTGPDWVILGQGGSPTMTVNAGGRVESHTTEFLIKSANIAHLVVDGGVFNRSGWLHLGGELDGDITLNSGTLNIGVLYAAQDPGGTANVTINGGVANIPVLAAGNDGNGVFTLDLNGGQLFVEGGVLEGNNSTFYIGSGEMIFTTNINLTVGDIVAQVSGPNWIYAEAPSVVDNGDGTVTVTSGPIPPPRIVSSSVSNNVMKIVVDVPSSANKYYYPMMRSNLVTDTWGGVAHSDDGVNPFVVTNLGYSSMDPTGTNEVIYVQVDHEQKFFKINGDNP